MSVETTFVDSRPFDVAVVIQTVLRPTLLRAVRSVFRQDFSGSIQVVIGIDRRDTDDDIVDVLKNECPSHIYLTIIELGYSTSIHRGGIYSNKYGGSLRTLLSYAANSLFVAYLDDDDWWAHNHLSSLRAAIEGKDWSFSYRWMADKETGWPICKDEWDSLGVSSTGINQSFGGFSGPSTLMLNKVACHFVLPYWSLSPFADGCGEDRYVFEALRKNHSWGATRKFSSFCDLSVDVQQHPHHKQEFSQRRLDWIFNRKIIDSINALVFQAEKAFSEGYMGDVVKKCKDVLSLHPHHTRALCLLAISEYRSGQLEEARRHIQRAIEIDNGDNLIAAAVQEIGEPELPPIPISSLLSL